MTTKIDLTPAILDLSLYAGDGEDFQIIVKDPAGAPIDVSDFTWEAKIKELRTSTDVSEIFAVTIDTTNASTGVLVLHISNDVTEILPKVSYWDLQCTSSTTQPRTLLQGTVTCSKDVTP